MTILLVDDEPHYLLLLGDYLRNQGWTVLTAENGEDALGTLRTRPVDIVISDIYMPVLNGIELQKRMRELPGGATTPFLFVSAYADSSTLSTIDLSANVKYLSKSVSPAKLREWIVYLTAPPSAKGKHPAEELPSDPGSRPGDGRNARNYRRR